LTCLDGRIDPFDQRAAPTAPRATRALCAQRKPYATTLDHDFFAPFCGIQDGGKALPDLRARIAFHAYIVQLWRDLPAVPMLVVTHDLFHQPSFVPPIILSAAWPTRRFPRTR
jgi:hypothetical protein